MKGKKTRRDFLKKTAITGLAGLAIPSLGFGLNNVLNLETENSLSGSGIAPATPFELPALPYAYDALEPYIDKMTMEIHHTKHHKAYVDNLNKAVTENNINGSLEELIANISKYPMAVRNNGGGHWNHSFFWKLMTPIEGGKPAAKLVEAINSSFGSFDILKSSFNDAAMKRFGSGWAWVVSKDGKLQIGSTPNQDNPLMDISDFKGTPVMGLDVWEHAYYLKYQNKRADYVNAWWNLINWDQVADNFSKIK